MKHKWRKKVFISVFVFCALIFMYIFALPFFVRHQLNDLNNISIYYKGIDQSITDAEEISGVLGYLRMSGWKRTFDDNADIVPEVYIAVNNMYLLLFKPYANQDTVDITICFLRSHIIIGTYKMDAQYYRELVSFLDAILVSN